MIDHAPLLALCFGSLFWLSSAVAYERGRRSGGVFRVYQNRPLTYVQFDPAMSQEEMVEFLEGVAANIRANGLAESYRGKDECADD
ncbi:hypothetical protein [Pseudomonas sp. USHLN015]|uniref:hypothetical protein n=1 Tax=Pseudomonas sp. USHLN015 TaxID=3081296 RepID=UPI00301D47B0